MFNLRKASRTPDQLQAAKDALNEAYRQYKSVGELAADTEFVYKSAQLIREMARDIWKGTDPTPLFFDRREGPGLGNWVEIKEFVNTSKVLKRSLGGKTTTFTPHMKKYTFELQDYRIDFAVELEQVLTGQMDASIFADYMGDAIGRFYMRDALAAIDAACQPGVLDQYNNPTRTNVGGELDQTALDAALRILGEANPGVVIAGRYTSLFPMMDFDGYSDVALEEIRQQGGVGRYKGAQVVILRDTFNPFWKESTIPADRVYLIGGEKGGLFIEEDMSILDYQVVDQEELHQRIGTKLRSTFFVHKPWKYHVLDLSAS